MSDYIDGDVLLAINYLMFKFMDIFREKKNYIAISMICYTYVVPFSPYNLYGSLFSYKFLS